MKLEFRQEYLSITTFNPVELESLTVLTGVNGSGKSQLLDAIANKSVAITECDSLNIVHFNYETFKLENESSFNAQSISTEKENAWSYFTENIKPSLTSWKTNLR
ncbi:MAG: hypothetical protein H0A76_05090 [Candidatus Thiodubiliella endoseptemdiera]|uniref:AAA domain-containing protein n=1 Tax=Candidatus Thiodubiliella endoseptemdiera TaxID=2738886 RepID=A0A853F1C4_9GAMM|nr:hypothetical protein [Candidatus Thiodubiliella endoseptemdiera]